MPIYAVEQYELCSTTYKIDANSEAEAIAKVITGEYGELGIVGSAQEYIAIEEQMGRLKCADHPELVAQLMDLGVFAGNDFSGDEIIRSIRSVEEVED